MNKSQKIAKIIGVLIIIPIIIFGLCMLREALSLKFVYKTTFTNNALITIPDEIYSKIRSENLTLRVNKEEEYQTYTTEVLVNGQIFKQTYTTKVGSLRRNYNDLVFNQDIPKNKQFNISITPNSTQPFILEIYEKRW